MEYHRGEAWGVGVRCGEGVEGVVGAGFWGRGRVGERGGLDAALGKSG